MTSQSPAKPFAFSLLGAAALAAMLMPAPAQAGSPEPYYPGNITATDRVSPGAVVFSTKDSPETVVAWYRAHLKDKIAEHKDAQGYILYTKSGSTIVISPPNRFEPTRVTVEWDAKKYGPDTGK